MILPALALVLAILLLDRASGRGGWLNSGGVTRQGYARGISVLASFALFGAGVALANGSWTDPSRIPVLLILGALLLLNGFFLWYGRTAQVLRIAGWFLSIGALTFSWGWPSIGLLLLAPMVLTFHLVEAKQVADPRSKEADRANLQ